MSLAFGELPNSEFFEEMDPYLRLWMFYSWAEKNKYQADMLKDMAILNGAFTNLEMAKQMSAPPSYESSDDDWDASWDYVKAQEMPKDTDALGGITEGRASRRKSRKVIE